jgi:acetoin utilization protein AcuB
MKQMPKMEKLMTPTPYTIEAGESMKSALQLMRKHCIRHLPVIKFGKVVGVVSDRDIKLASGFEGSENMAVEDIMTLAPK